MLNDFAKRVEEKEYIKPILPKYEIGCTFIMNEQNYTIIISGSGIKFTDMLEHSDVYIYGDADSIEKLLFGQIRLSDSKLNFKGTYRQFLLMDSIFYLAKKQYLLEATKEMI